MIVPGAGAARTRRQPVNATGSAGSDPSGRAFRSIRDVVRDRNGNRQEAGVGGRQTAQDQWRRRCRAGETARCTQVTCAVEIVRSRTVNIVSNVEIRAVFRYRIQVVFVSYRQMRVIRRRRDRAPLRADANPTRCRRCALDGQHQQEEDQNCAMNARQHGGAKVTTGKRPSRVAFCDRASSTEVPRLQKTLHVVGQRSTRRLAQCRFTPVICRHSSAQRRHACAQAWQCSSLCFAHSAPQASQMSAHASQIWVANALPRAM